jgi:predicted nucleotide-binding protein
MVEKQASSDAIPPGVKLRILTVSPEEASTLLNKRLVLGRRIARKAWERSPMPVYMAIQKLQKWDRYNSALLNGMFTTPQFVNKYNSCTVHIDREQANFLEEPRHLRAWFSVKEAELEAVKEQLPLFALKSTAVAAGVAKSFGNKVFIVHGRDEATKESVARVLEHLGLNAVILHEKPNKGRTTIEKLLEESDVDVGYAVVLLTSDDVGKLASEEGEPSPRARQNVIFELGLFVAKLGRERVHALYRKGVEIPTDYLGVLYTPLDDNGAWRMKLAKELQAVGFNIDLNKLIA